MSFMTYLRKCPRCGSDGVIRSKRRTLEHLLVGFKPYRCNACQRRFFFFFTPKQTARHSAHGSRKTSN